MHKSDGDMASKTASERARKDDDESITCSGKNAGLTHTDVEKRHRLYGLFILIGHLLSWLWIFKRKDYLIVFDPRAMVCWPTFTNCHEWASVLQPIIFPTLVAFTSATVVFIGVFLRFRLRQRQSRILIAIAFMLQLSFIALDYRMRLNQHLMLFAIDLAYILFANSVQLTRVLLVLFYFFAGLLKFDSDWLSGAALYKPVPLIPSLLLPTALKYVIVLETLMSWLLLSKHRILRFFVLIQLFVFHGLSWGVVGFYYPLLMLCLLSLFLIYDTDFSESKFKLPIKESIAIGVFVILQLLPRVLSRDFSITNQGRIFALHMFDGKINCEHTVEWSENGLLKKESLPGQFTVRLNCDPVVFWFQLKNFCRIRGQAIEAPILAQLTAKRSTEENFRRIVYFPNACKNPLPEISNFYNSWVIEPGEDQVN